MSKKILITGASGGFGSLMVQTFLKDGFTVVASMRGVTSKNKTIAAEFERAGAKIVEIDVTDEKSVESGISQAISLVGGMDVVVNNAGVGAIGLQESFTPEDWQKLFNINVFGVQRINRAILPHMRKQGTGLLVHISSILGRMPLAFYGPYNASKWALEALAENYRVELSQLGIDSCIIEPGGYPTNFMENLVKPSDDQRDASYGPLSQAPMQLFTNFEHALKANPAQNPQNVADAVLNLVNTPAGQRPLRTTVDKMGMGDPIKSYNEQLEQITSHIYNSFGMGNMLKLKV